MKTENIAISYYWYHYIKLYCKAGHRIPIVVHYSEIKILFPVLRKLITSTDNQIKNVKLRIAESNDNQINNKNNYLN